MILKTYKILFFYLIVSVISINNSYVQFTHMRGKANFDGSFFGSDVGQGIRADYSRFLNSTFLIQPTLFFEWGFPFQSSDNNVGADLLIGFKGFDMGQKFAFFLKDRVTGGHEELIRLQKGITGFSAEAKGVAEIDFMASEDLLFSFYTYQSYLAKKVFGRSFYQIGLGIKFNLSNY